MSSEKDPKIAEMGKAIFETLGSLPEFNKAVFNTAFAREAKARHMHLGGCYFYNLRQWVQSDVTSRISRAAKRLAENPAQQHQEPAVSTREQQLHSFLTEGQQLRLF